MRREPYRGKSPCDDSRPCRSIPLNPKRKGERFLTNAEFIRAKAGLHDVRIHDIRHSCASVALSEAA